MSESFSIAVRVECHGKDGRGCPQAPTVALGRAALVRFPPVTYQPMAGGPPTTSTPYAAFGDLTLPAGWAFPPDAVQVGNFHKLALCPACAAPERARVLCGGCNVRDPWEHRCSGAHERCDCPSCDAARKRLGIKENP